MELTDSDRAAIKELAMSMTADCGIHHMSATKAVYRAGIIVGLERAARACDERAAACQAMIDKGKGTWPGPDYIRDEIWARWFGVREAALSDAAACRALAKP